VAWGLVILAIADIGASVALVRGARRVRERSLIERAIAAAILTVIVTIGAVLSTMFLTHTRIDPDLFTLLLITVFVCAAAPQLIWYAAYRSGQFR